MIYSRESVCPRNPDLGIRFLGWKFFGAGIRFDGRRYGAWDDLRHKYRENESALENIGRNFRGFQGLVLVFIRQDGFLQILEESFLTQPQR